MAQENSDGIDRQAVQREAKGAAAEILREPDVEQAIEILRRELERAATPVRTHFPGDIADGYEKQLKEDILRGVSKRLKRTKK